MSQKKVTTDKCTAAFQTLERSLFCICDETRVSGILCAIVVRVVEKNDVES